jgi:hypothetical protein
MSGVEEGGGEPSSGNTPDKKSSVGVSRRSRHGSVIIRLTSSAGEWEVRQENITAANPECKENLSQSHADSTISSVFTANFLKEIIFPAVRCTASA